MGEQVMETVWNLSALGFSPREVHRLSTLKRRYDRGTFVELTEEAKRLAFARWLVTHGKLSESWPVQRSG